MGGMEDEGGAALPDPRCGAAAPVPASEGDSSIACHSWSALQSLAGLDDIPDNLNLSGML